jgi:hypothetical protein
MSVQTSNFSQSVQKYILVDEEIQKLQNQIKTLREQKHDLQDKITTTMNTNNWQNRSLEIGNFELSLTERKQYSSLSYTYLEKTLSQIIPDKTQLEYVLKYLREKREVKTIQEIKKCEKTPRML